MAITRKQFLKSAASACTVLGVGTAILKPAEARTRPMRPPGALPEDEFLSVCIRCRQCADACPNQCITAYTPESGRRFSMTPGSAEEGTPVIFPRAQACNLCQKSPGDKLLCTDACPTGALQVIKKEAEEIKQKVQMGVAEVDTNLCWSYNGSSCGVCVKACPFEGKALRAGQLETPIMDPEFCVGCGLCERSCIRYPQAITIKPVARTV